MITTIHKHITQLQIEKQNIRDEDLKSILTNVYDDFQKHGMVNDVLTLNENFKAMEVFCKHMIDNQVHKNISHPQIIDHKLFSLMENTILSILQKANGDDWNVFHAMASLLTSYLPVTQFADEKVNKIIRKTFYSDRFLSAIKECIKSLLLSNYQNGQIECRILSYVFQQVYSHTINKGYKKLLHSSLVDAVVPCIVSQRYANQFSKNEEESNEFFLFDCPYFVLSNSADRHKEIANLLCQPLLKDHKNILAYRGNRKHVNSQKNEYLTSYLKLLNHCAIIESARDMFTQHLPSIVTQLFATLKDYVALDGEIAINYIKDEELVANALTLLYNLTANSTILAIIKENAPMPILLLLCGKGQQQIIINSERKKNSIPESIQFPARSLVALATEDVDRLDQPNEVTSLFFTNLNVAVKNDSQMYAGVHASTILISITAIAQNDSVKKQIVEHEGALSLLSNCICDPIIAVDIIQQPALNAIWTISFNEEARLHFRSDQKLVIRLQEIFKSDNFDQKKAADGIMWILVNEEKFRTEQSNIQRVLVYPNEKIQNPTYEEDKEWVKLNSSAGQITVHRDNLTKEQNEMIAARRNQTSNLQMKTTKPYKYDLMISYCHKNAELCHIIYNCLSKIGKYKIWIDKEKMHGSMMERMAEAIEESHLMLICMSNAYKLSKPCQAECRYAFRRNHEVLFLKIESNYKPDGWLGISLSDEYYVDITKADFLAKFKDIVKQISIKRNEAPDYDGLIDTIVTTDVKTAVINALKRQDKTICTASTESISVNIDKMPPSDMPSTARSTTSDTDSQQINLQQPMPISSLSVLLSFESSTAILDSQSKIKDECFTPGKLAKYHPSNFDNDNVNTNQDSLNDFALKMQTPSIPNLPHDEFGTDREMESCNPFRICLLLFGSHRNSSSNE